MASPATSAYGARPSSFTTPESGALLTATGASSGALHITSIILITSVGRDDLAFAEVRKCAAEDDVFRAFLLEKFGNKTIPFLFDLTANDVFAQAGEETPN